MCAEHAEYCLVHIRERQRVQLTCSLVRQRVAAVGVSTCQLQLMWNGLDVLRGLYM